MGLVGLLLLDLEPLEYGGYEQSCWVFDWGLVIEMRLIVV